MATAGVAQQICSSQQEWLNDAYYVKYHDTLQMAFFEWKLLTTFTYPLSGTKYLDPFRYCTDTEDEMMSD